MRPRGKTQEQCSEAMQTLSGTQQKNQSFNFKVNNSGRMATKRRQGCPQTALHLWDAIAYIRQQKQIPNFDRLSAYMKRVYNLNPPDLERQLKFAVSDDLIVLKKSLGCKGSKVGVEQDGYRIPEEEQARDGHDWYCFECHRGGEVVLCSTCHRVYHEVCISNDSNSKVFICPVCKQNPERFPASFRKSELNILLSFTCVRLKEKTRELHRIPHPDDEKWRFNFLIYEPMDLTTMEDKMKNCEYNSLGEFFTDSQQIVHNVAVYFGKQRYLCVRPLPSTSLCFFHAVQSAIAEMARQMLIDCEYDLSEIVRCASCYKMSNSKHDKLWFCQPCDPPHELVFAKLRGYPYWPAKVIKKYDTWYDVRFFGAKHQRGQIDDGYVKPINTSFQKLGVKKTASFERAYNELRHHQQLVEKASKGLINTKTLNGTSASNDKSESDSAQDSSSSTKTTPLPSRKRKSMATPASVKPPSAKKPATVPVKKNKKFYQESPTSSSPKNDPQDCRVLLEDHNFVSSSSQETVAIVSVAVQTENEPIPPEDSPSNKTINKDDSNNATVNACDCSSKYDKLLKDLQVRLDDEHKEDKSKALKELSERLRAEMEVEKQKSVNSAVEKLQNEFKASAREAEAARNAAHQAEIEKLIEQHKLEISETKKKQWCYNCEVEAIYHCCWNTSYCSVECQQAHWHKEHKRTCRRKR